MWNRNSTIVLVLLLAVAATGLWATGTGEPAAATKTTLRIATSDFAEERLYLIKASQGVNVGTVSPMYDPLIKLDKQGRVSPMLAKKWELAPDGLSWIFYLRDDVVFHDGSKMTADDVIWSLTEQAKNGLKAPVYQQFLGKEPKVEKIDNYTIRIYSNGPQPLLPQQLAWDIDPWFVVLPKDYIAKNGEDYFQQHPVGTGPYKFVKHAQGQYYEWEAFDNYWGAKAEFKHVIDYLVREETTTIAMLKTGQIDAANVSLEGALELKKQGFDIQYGCGGQIYMPIHGSYHALAKDKPLGNVKVRQALSLAINRQEIIDTLYYGFAQMPAPARSDFNREDMTDYLRGKWMPWSAKNYGYDLDKAKQLLKEAGWDKGFSFDLWAVPDSSAPNLPDLITAVAGYWEKIGAHANIINADAAGYTKIKNTRKSTEAVGAVGTGATDLFGSSILKMNKYTSDQTSENWLDFSPSIQEFDALYKEGMSCMDPKRREQIIDRMLELTTSSWTCIPLITAPLTFVIGPRVKADVSPVAVYLERQISSFKYSGKEPK